MFQHSPLNYHASGIEDVCFNIDSKFTLTSRNNTLEVTLGYVEHDLCGIVWSR